MTYAVTTQTPTQLAESTPWGAVVDAFLASAVDSANTRRAYARHLSTAFEALGVLAVADLTGASLAQYRAAITDLDLSPSSQGQALAAMRAFLKWSKAMGAHNLPGDVIAAALRTPTATVRRPYQVLTAPEAAALLRAAGNPRDRAIAAVMLGAGLRVSEVVGLDPRDVIEDGEGAASIYVRSGKGRKDRTVPINDDVAQHIRAYLHATGRTLSSDGALFLAHDRASARGRLTANAIRQLVARLSEAAGITAKAVSPHTLRHTYGTRHFAASKNLLALQKILGHSAVTTTQRYADHFEQSELRETVPALPV